MKQVAVIEWTEHERGWGQRPDGFSYHPSMEAAEQFIKDYWSRQPKETPDEYSAPSTPWLVFVNEVAWLLIEGNGHTWSMKAIHTKVANQ